jgi:ribonuclease D
MSAAHEIFAHNTVIGMVPASKEKLHVGRPIADHIPPPYEMVEELPDLRRTAKHLQTGDIIGVDLEADSMFHYQEKVCLVQMASNDRTFLIDPLALKDLSPLAPVFADPGVRKVFHGADYDIRSLYRDFGIEVRSLFDTQIAARFLGFRETSLASLLKDLAGLVIDKKYQKKDWSQRPLPSAMCVYAAQDACHLKELSKVFEERLRAKGLLFCVEEECEVLSKVRPTLTEERPFFLRFKGAGNLDSRSLAVLEALLQFRDELARKQDRPPFKIVGNTPLMEMAQKKPVNMSELKSVGRLSARQIESLGSPFLQRISEALSLPEKALPSYPHKPRSPYDPKVAKRIRALKEWRVQRSKGLGMDSALPLSNAQIRSLVDPPPQNTGDLQRIDGLRNWQRRLFGNEICTLLDTVG